MSSQGKPQRPSGARPLRPRRPSRPSIGSSVGIPAPTNTSSDSISKEFFVTTYSTFSGEDPSREHSSDASFPYWNSPAGGPGSPPLNTIESASIRMLREQPIEEEPGFFPLDDEPRAVFASPTSTLLSESNPREVLQSRETEPSFFSAVQESPKPFLARSLPLSVSPPPSRPPSRASETTPKSSRAHWARIRQAVLASSFPLPSPRLPTDDSSPSSFRPSTPSSTISSQRPLRFPRLGFRGASEQLRANSKSDAQRVFESEIEAACSIIRSAVASDPDLWVAQRSAPYPTPPVRNVNHVQGGSSGSASGLARLGRGLRRPPSSQSLGSVAASVTRKGTQSPGFGQLQSTLLHFLSLPGIPSFLPRQTEVLSVLLLPFLQAKDNSLSAVEENRSHAVDVFEVILANWKSDTTEGEVERCLWSLKALTLNNWNRPVPSISLRLLASVTSLLYNPPSTKPSVSPVIQQTLFQHLVLLQHMVVSYEHPPELYNMAHQVGDLARHIQDSGFALTDEGSLISEYNLVLKNRLTAKDRDATNMYLFSEAVVRLLRLTGMVTKTWILQNLLDSYWLPPPPMIDRSVVAPIALRRLGAFAEFAVDHLNHNDYTRHNSNFYENARLILNVLRLRIIPESSALFEFNPLCLSHAVRIVLGLFRSRSTRDDVHTLLNSWRTSQGPWRDIVEHELGLMIKGENATALHLDVRCLFDGTSGDCQKYLMSIVMPHLFERLVTSPVPSSTSFTSLLNSVAETHPHVFYKPLFDCARANKDATVVTQIRILLVLSEHIPNLFVRDPGMMAMALASNAGSTIGKGKARASDAPQWGKARVGQCVLMMELLTQLHNLIAEKRHMSPAFESSPMEDFFIELENKMAILLNAKEQTIMVPFSQRILLCHLFLQMRRYTSSARRALWLPTVVNWASQCEIGAIATAVEESTDIPSESHSGNLLVNEDVLREAEFTLSRVGMIYSSSFASTRESKPTSMLLSHALDLAAHDRLNLFNLKEREAARNSLPNSVKAASLPLLVAMCGQLREHDFRRILPPIWFSGLEDPDCRVGASSCFLFMLCAEKIPTQARRLIEDDLYSDVAETRHRAVQRLTKLYSLRSPIQTPDGTRDRLFKVAAKPLSFVATDMGSQKWASDRTPNDALAILGASLPGDIRRRLLELDWIKTAQEKEEERSIKWHQLPLSVLPRVTLDVAEHVQNIALVNAQSPERTYTAPEGGGLLKRKPSSGSSAVRRKVLIVPSIVQTISKLISLFNDDDLSVMNTAQELLRSALMDDPSTFCRPSIEALDDRLSTPSDATNTLSAYIHIQSSLPPHLSHHILNHLVGYVKNLARDTTESSRNLPRVAAVMPLISQLASTINDLSFRDIKRNKAETLLLPTFDFSSSATLVGSLLSRSHSSQPQSGRNDEDAMSDMMTIHIAQNMFLYRHVLRHQKDLQVIRKQFSMLRLPFVQYNLPLRLFDFFPEVTRKTIPIPPTGVVHRRSLILSRSYLLAVLQIFRSINQNLTDISELSKFIDGVNLVMVVHGEDLGVVSHALMAYMAASTRFRRIFSAHSGFEIIMPAILKVYCERWNHSGIRAAIEYTVHRFYAVHENGFIFQSLEVLSRMLLSPVLGSSKETFAKHVFPLFASLYIMQHGNTVDAAGIHDSNIGQEREAVLTLLNETPEILLLPSRSQGVDPTSEVILSTFSNLVERWKGRRFPLDDLIRLLLTIIAHAPAVKRAEGFLRILRCWAVDLCEESTSTRNVLQQGIEALGGTLFGKASKRPRMQEQFSARDDAYRDKAQYDETSISASVADPNVLRQEYIALVTRFSGAGGSLNTHTIQSTFGLVKYVVKDQGATAGTLATDFVQQMTNRVLAKGPRPSANKIVPFLAEVGPLFRELGTIVDLSSVIDAVTSLIRDGSFSSDKEFVHVVVSQFCRQALEACTSASNQKRLLDYPARQSIVSLLVAAATLTDSVVISMIEQQPLTPSFLACIVLPFCLTVRFNDHTPCPGWLRLLSYIIHGYSRLPGADTDTLKRNVSTGSPEKSEKRRESSNLGSPRNRAIGTMMVLQIIKVIVVRAEVYSQPIMCDLWSRMAGFIRRLLAEASVKFVLYTSGTNTQSPHPSRPVTPASLETVKPGRISFSSDAHDESSSLSAPQQIRSIDYTLASMMEFIALYRSPLTLQLRLWAQERLAELEVPPHSTGIRGLSPTSPGARRLSSMFSKIRPRSVHSPDPIDTSPFLTSREPTTVLSVYPEDPNITRQAAYALPRSRAPSPSEGPSRNIVHLGPVTVHRVNSEGSSGSHSHRSTDRIDSAELVRSAVKKTQVAQAWFGFGNEDMTVHAWTRGVALEQIWEETKCLMHDYRDVFTGSIRASYVEVLPT